ncbi:unnamed protein product [Lampetra planeri]
MPLLESIMGFAVLSSCHNGNVVDYKDDDVSCLTPMLLHNTRRDPTGHCRCEKQRQHDDDNGWEDALPGHVSSARDDGG